MRHRTPKPARRIVHRFLIALAVPGIPFVVIVGAPALTPWTPIPAWTPGSGLTMTLAAAFVLWTWFCIWLLNRAWNSLRDRCREANGLLCPDCGYDVRDLAPNAPCPECGCDLSKHDPPTEWRRTLRMIQ